MLGNGEAQKEAIRPDFNRSIFIDFSGAKITSDAGFLLMREVDQRFGIIESGCSQLVDNRSASRDLCITYKIFGSQAKSILQNSVRPYQKYFVNNLQIKLFNYALLVAIKHNICHTFLKNQSIGGWYGFQKNK